MKVIRTAPMTRAQQFQWYFERSSLLRLWRLTDTDTHASVRRVVRSLVEEFETLRTIVDYRHGELFQLLLEPAPRITQVGWPAHERPPSAQALGISVPLDRGASVGTTRVRFAIAEYDSAPTWLAMVADHVTLDGSSAAMVDRYVQRLLGREVSPGQVEPAPRRHPVQLADYEASSAGQRERSRSRRYLSAQLADGALVNYPGKDRQNTAYIEMRTLIAGARELLRTAARRLQTDASSLILGALGFILSHDSGNESPYVNVSVSNRFTEFRRSVAGAVAQRIPITIRPRRARSCFDYVRSATDALLPAYRHATYSPRDLIDIAAALGTHAWACDAAFNFVDRGPDQPLAEAMPGQPERSVRTVHRDPGYPYSVRYQLALFGPDILGTVLMDAEVFTVTRAQRFLAAFEYALRRAGLGEDTTEDDIRQEFPVDATGS